MPLAALSAPLHRSCRHQPGIGITRHIVVAESDDEARAIANAAYPRWRDAMEYLWRRSNMEFVLKEIYPRDFLTLERIGHGVAGSPATVRDYLARLHTETGVKPFFAR